VSTASDNISANNHHTDLKRFLCMLLTYFAGIAAVCSILTLGLSSTACLWNSHVVCFSFGRHGSIFITEVARQWLFVAFFAALLAAIAAHFQWAQKWWHDFGLVCGTIVIAGLLVDAWAPKKVMLANSALREPLVFAIELVALQVAFLLCRLAAKRICKAES
jgi:hypothetical protein